MSALPPKADIRCRDRHVRFVPKADVSRCSNSSLPEARQPDGMAVTIRIVGNMGDDIEPAVTEE
jgi:hypothetical protein